MKGPGKYDTECTTVLLKTHAVGVLLLVVGGDRGDGFCISTTDAEFMRQLPRMLRETANEIEGDVHRLTGGIATPADGHRPSVQALLDEPDDEPER